MKITEGYNIFNMYINVLELIISVFILTSKKKRMESIYHLFLWRISVGNYSIFCNYRKFMCRIDWQRFSFIVALHSAKKHTREIIYTTGNCYAENSVNN